MDTKRKNGSSKTARVKTVQRGPQEGWIRTAVILNLVEEGSKELKKTAILSILVLVLMLAIMALANGCAHHQTLQRCVERHGQPARVGGEGDAITQYEDDPGRIGHTNVLPASQKIRENKALQVTTVLSKKLPRPGIGLSPMLVQV